MRTYCNDCKYFYWFYGYESCKKVIGVEYTPIKKMNIYAQCNVANKDNHCKYFKPKMWKRLKEIAKINM